MTLTTMASTSSIHPSAPSTGKTAPVELPGQVIAFDVSDHRVCAQLEDTSISCWGDLLKAGEPRDNWKPQLVDWGEDEE
ncbi:MAG: hypothetical protein RBU37_27820 [Myxococcota bacterium]|nr:hypothetical protein [Myxococcota bacterium]